MADLIYLLKTQDPRLKTISIVFVFLLGTLSLSAQNSKDRGLSLEAYSGIRLGWWQYNAGPESGDIFADGALDYTHLRIFIPVGISLGYGLERWHFSAGGSWSYYDEDVIRKHQLAANVRDRYVVSDKAITLVHFWGQVEHHIIKLPGYKLSPSVKGGTFVLNASHPDEEDFGAQYFFEVGLANQLRFLEGWLLLRPAYQWNRILSKSDQYGNRIFSLGMDIGYRYYF